jgi:glycosyltransferase involved in cell wall biosynthesis
MQVLMTNSERHKPMDSPLNVSVIVPCRNAGRTLQQCLHSLQVQRYRQGSVSILLVDNGSTDDSVEIARRFSEIVQLQVLHPSIYAARNLGASAATGEILVFTQADCILDPYCVEQHVAALDRANASISVGKQAPIKTTPLLSMFEAYEQARDVWSFGTADWTRYFGRPKNLAIRRQCFDQHGPFERVVRGADSLFVQKVARESSCDEITFCPDAVARQLSVDGLGSFLRYQFQNSRIMYTLRSSHSAPVQFRDQIRLFRQTTREQGYGILRSTVLLLLLGLGLLTWKAGRWSVVLLPTKMTDV